jgi:hypothetical protein
MSMHVICGPSHSQMATSLQRPTPQQLGKPSCSILKSQQPQRAASMLVRNAIPRGALEHLTAQNGGPFFRSFRYLHLLHASLPMLCTCGESCR